MIFSSGVKGRKNVNGPKVNSVAAKRSASMAGVGKLTLLVFGPLIAALIFCAYHVIPFYYYYFELIEQFKSAVSKADVYSDKDLREKIKAHLRRAEIPADIDQVRIVRTGNVISISLDYQEVFFVRFRGKDYVLHVFPFHAVAEGAY